MTEAVNDRLRKFSGDGSTIAFDTDFKVDGVSEVLVQTRLADGSLSTVSSGITVTVDSATSLATVTFDTAPASTTEVILSGDTTLSQDADFTLNGALSSADIEAALDVLMRVAQEQDRDLSRCLRIGMDENLTPLTSDAATRANSFLMFGATGELVAGAATASLIPVADAGDIITATNVEGALQEHAAAIAANAAAIAQNVADIQTDGEVNALADARITAATIEATQVDITPSSLTATTLSGALVELAALAAGEVNPPTVTYLTSVASLDLSDLSVIRTLWYDSNMRAGSGAEWEYTGTTTAARAGDGLHTDGYLYDSNGRQYQPRGEVNARAYGATGDGTTPDHGAVQLAMTAGAATGLEVHLAGTLNSYRFDSGVSLSSQNNFRMSGDGYASKIDSYISDTENLITLTNCNRPTIKGIHLDLQNGTYTSAGTLQGAGIYCNNSTEPLIEDVWVYNGRRWGIILRTCNDGVVRRPNIYASTMSPTALNTDSGGGVYVTGNSNRCSIHGGRAYQQGVAFGEQTLLAGEVMSNNSWTDCIARDSYIYGFMTYTVANSTITGPSFTDCKAIRVRGGVGNTAQSNALAFGAGFYIQQVDHAHLHNVFAQDTNEDTASATLGPASIAFLNCTRSRLNGATIIDSGWHGLAFFNPLNLGQAGGKTVVENVTIDGADEAAVFVKDYSNISFKGITTRNVSKASFGVDDTAGSDSLRAITLTGFDFEVAAGQQGIQLFDCEDAAISDGHVNGGLDCMTVDSTCSGTRVTNVTFKGATRRGINGFDDDMLVDHCTFRNCAEGIHFGARIKRGDGNILIGNTADYGGTYAPWYEVGGSGDTTPSLKNATHVLLATDASNDITAFDDMEDGQVVIIVTGGRTLTHSSSLELAGSVDFAMGNGDMLTIVRRINRATEIARMER